MKQMRPPKIDKPPQPRGAAPREYSRLIVRHRRDSPIRRLASFGIVR